MEERRVLKNRPWSLLSKPSVLGVLAELGVGWGWDVLDLVLSSLSILSLCPWLLMSSAGLLASSG